MTPEQFRLEMAEIAKIAIDDAEIAHGMADSLLCRLLVELGYEEGVKLFVAMDKWYA